MLFNSFEFLLFLPISFLLFTIVSNKKILVLILSYLFYMYWNPAYIILILFSTIVDFYIAQRIELALTRTKKKVFLVFSIFLNMTLLFVFKYYNFFVEAAGHESLMMNILLPVGISFYTFQTMGYSIDVYKGDIKAEKNLLNFSLFVCYFPQLVAGPIEKAKKLIPSLNSLNHNKLLIDNIVVEKIFVGLFKKVIVADRLAVYVNHIYSSSNPSSLDIAAVFYLFAIQIYCDFSGYCDIAVGVSRAFGIRLSENFLQPYFSSSIKEFWSRWHITLSSWFRDYLYIPLGGKYGMFKGALNLFIVFLVSGLWHGANWTFVVWGGIHGFYLLLEKYLDPFRSFTKAWQVLINFHLVCFAWIFFRSNSVDQALNMISTFFKFKSIELNLGGSLIDLCFGLICFFIVLIYDFYIFRNRKSVKNLKQTIFESYWGRFVGGIIIMIFGVFSQTEFLYFQF